MQTWGVQNTEEEAHAQMDYFVKECKGNLIDTAELYPVPTTHSKYRPGTTELMVGTWMAKNTALRKDIFLGTCMHATSLSTLSRVCMCVCMCVCVCVSIYLDVQLLT